MWLAYCTFYEAVVPQTTTDATFARLCDTVAPMHGTVAIDASCGEVVGFAHAVIHPYTWSTRSACYLEDLFVVPRARGLGAGRALIEDLISRARREGWGRIYWVTREGNATARSLYDTLATRDDFVRYGIDFDDV